VIVVAIPATVVVMIVPVPVGVPATAVFVPPFVELAPAKLARLSQIMSRMLRLGTVPPMMLGSFVKPVVGLDQAMPASIVVSNSTRSCAKKQDSTQRGRGQYNFSDQPGPSSQKRLHRSIPPLSAQGLGLADCPPA
jgi:hypothetical protein